MNRYGREQSVIVVKDARDMLTGIIPATNDELAAMTAELLAAAG